MSDFHSLICKIPPWRTYRGGCDDVDVDVSIAVYKYHHGWWLLNERNPSAHFSIHLTNLTSKDTRAHGMCLALSRARTHSIPFSYHFVATVFRLLFVWMCVLCFFHYFRLNIDQWLHFCTSRRVKKMRVIRKKTCVNCLQKHWIARRKHEISMEQGVEGQVDVQNLRVLSIKRNSPAEWMKYD